MGYDWLVGKSWKRDALRTKLDLEKLERDVGGTLWDLGVDDLI